MFARLWNFIRRPTGYVGKDLQGNYFYEHASTTGDPRRTRRVVKYRGQMDTLAVAERSRQLTVQWKAWLTHTRHDPPTPEELRADVARLERLRHNVSLIEARDREERAQRLRLTFGTNERDSEALHRNNVETTVLPSNAGMGDANGAGAPERNLKEQQKRKLQEDVKRYAHNPWTQKQKELSHSSDEPQAWTPRAVQRGT